ncbi:pyridoxamine 5'-phosphate oxidase family protein [Fundicoccus sp. Sow4_F4]|uniref:pyridoxamine 5'-phosphate oxidase family protein n=1 Tax=Fundicoccus sp. Sow4_F4 TaxID=3438783 RepID=UPI003F92FE87
MSEEKKLTREEHVEKVRQLIKDSDIALLTTVTPDGLETRPMMTQEVEFDGDLWFFTLKDTAKVTEITENPAVNVGYVHKNKSFVSIRGVAEVVEDTEKKEELWNKAYEAIFDVNAKDPSLILLKVLVQSVEYWESGSIVKSAFNIARKLLIDDAETDLGTNATVELDV